ncbi:WAT1-related protein [Panicum miliaceum]|uniref:WAT1-related protein n=1 Tax=Panicum miliaceum TaxID=4540 RepID=A0A3L6QU08_PANMI|nr:WAT1-related protein [Panicum miliaceum]
MSPQKNIYEMDAKKPYVVAIIIQLIYTGMFVILKAAFNQGFNTFVFTFYCQAAATVLLLPIAILRERKSWCSMSSGLLLKLFICALIGMEVVNLKSAYGIAKVTGVALCLAGVLLIAFFAGPALSPINHHHAFHSGQTPSAPPGRVTWIKGTFLKILGDMIWSLWITLQAALLKEYPNKMLVTVTQSVFSTVQLFVVAAVAERDISRWKLGLDFRLLAVLYTGFVVAGVCSYLQVWCMEMKGPVFLAMWFPLCSVLTIFCSSFFLGEIVHLGSILGAILLIGGLYSVLWAKSKETMIEPCSEVNPVESAKDEKEQNKPEVHQEDGRGKNEEETSAYTVERVYPLV